MLLFAGCLCFCDSNEMRCADGQCVPMTKVMDGKNDCKDGKYDEGMVSETTSRCFNPHIHVPSGLVHPYKSDDLQLKGCLVYLFSFLLYFELKFLWDAKHMLVKHFFL